MTITKNRTAFSKALAVLMALSLVMMMTGVTVLAASAKAPSDLKDGTYTVDVALWHSSKDQASMAASCLKDQATLDVKNGKKTMTIYTQPMTMAGITASLQEMQVKQSDGTLKDAKVVEKSSEGNPTAFQFVVPNDDDYIDVEVNPHIELMGNQAMSARIKVDYSTLSETEDAVSSATERSFGGLGFLDKLRQKDTDTTSSATKTTEETTAEESTTAAEPATVSDSVKNTVSSKGLNKDKLEDGTYTVNVQLWHSEKDQASMANSALKKQAKIVVKNGNATMYIYTQPMTYGSITASLEEMKVERTNGTWETAQVAARSSDGTPTSFKFGLPSTNEYFNVQVNPHVEMMGNQFIDARIKVDWNSLKVASSEGTADPNGASSSNAGVSVSGSKSTAATGVDTGDHSEYALMGWFSAAFGAFIFALCAIILKKGLV